MPAQCVKLASLFYFILTLKLKGKRRGTHYRGGIFQIFEIVRFHDLFTLESF